MTHKIATEIENNEKFCDELSKRLVYTHSDMEMVFTYPYSKTQLLLKRIYSVALGIYLLSAVIVLFSIMILILVTAKYLFDMQIIPTELVIIGSFCVIVVVLVGVLLLIFDLSYRLDKWFEHHIGIHTRSVPTRYRYKDEIHYISDTELEKCKSDPYYSPNLD